MFEFLFNQPLSAYREASLVFESGWPLAGLALAILAAFALIGASLWRRPLAPARRVWIGLLQGVVAGALLVMLWRPALEIETTRPGENTVAWLLDVSASMDIVDVAGRSRRLAALDAIDSAGFVDDPVFDARLLAVGADLQPADSLEALRVAPTPSARSALADGLVSLFDTVDERALAAVVLVTDGAENANGIDASWWRRIAAAGVPVHVVGVGDPEPGNDVELADVTMPPDVPAGSSVSAMLDIAHARGSPSVRLRISSGDELLLAEDVALSADRERTSHVAHFRAPDAGLASIEFDIEREPGVAGPETELRNNHQVRMLRSNQARRRVLYVEGEPRWEYKFIRRALHEDASVELVSLLRTSPNKFYRQGVRDATELANGFPATREELFAYDAVIVGSLEAGLLDSGQQAALRDFVDLRGGSLLMLGGRRGLADGGWARTAVAAALPVVLSARLEAETYKRQRVAVLPTRQGLRTEWLALGPAVAGKPGTAANLEPGGRANPEPVDAANPEAGGAVNLKAGAAANLDPGLKGNLEAWLSLPALADRQDVGRVKPGAVVLLETTADGLNDGAPVLVRQRYGLGTSQVLGTSGTWRWQMGLPSEDQRHESFWRNLVRELASSALARFELAPGAPLLRDADATEVSIVARAADFTPLDAGAVSASVLHPDGSATSVELVADPVRPGRFTAGVPLDADGPWGLRLDVVAAGESPPGPPASAEGWWVSESGSAEAFGFRRQAGFLERVAAVTGGGYLDIAELDRLPALLSSTNAALTREQRWPLWNMPALFLLILLAKAMEWASRLRWKRL